MEKRMSLLEGFALAGWHERGIVELLPGWAARRVVYVTVVDGRIIRVGKAWAGLGSRTGLHNRWAAGNFKSNDEREQMVRRLTLQGMGARGELWAKVVTTEAEARRLEGDIRRRFGTRLDVDLSARGSWIWKEMRNWRANRVCAIN
jgi:hypothetical protein